LLKEGDYRMVIVQLKGGLGNQLFQYSVARSLSEKQHSKVMLDLNVYNQTGLKPHEFYALNHFRINAGVANNFDLEFFYSNNTFKKIQRKIMRLTGTGSTKQIYEKKWFVFEPDIFTHTGNVYLHGYWQSEKYFRSIKNIIRAEISLKDPLTQKTLMVSKEILSKKNTVSLHIRRGDYVTDVQTYNTLGLCSLDYYKKCISILRKELGDLNIYVFSDDLIWVKKNLVFDFPLHFVDHNDIEYSYEDMYLMSLCEHNIIANSSFSWWGAWLNKNENKKVFVPQKWTVDAKSVYPDLIPEEWNLI
jgi:hypothetical protein